MACWTACGWRRRHADPELAGICPNRRIDPRTLHKSIGTLGCRLLTLPGAPRIGSRIERVPTPSDAEINVNRSPREAPMEANTMNLKPLDDRIVVRPNEAETQTASGLVIPDTAKEKPQQGEVLAVGPGKRSDTTGELIEVGIKRRRHRPLQQVRRHRGHRRRRRPARPQQPRRARDRRLTRMTPRSNH